MEFARMSLLFVSPPEGHAPAPQNGVLAMRAVHRAMADLRRGTPVLVGGPDGALVVAAAETVGAEGLRELMAVALCAPVLLLAPVFRCKT
jgi:GTP cyclohydrolase II